MQKKSSQTSPPSRKASAGRRKVLARKIVAYLKKAYPKPKTELLYDTPFQLVVAVIMSAQCTDKTVNRVTRKLFKKYKTVSDFARAKPAVFQKEISSVTFFRNKTKSIIGAAKMLTRGDTLRPGIQGVTSIPRTEAELVALPGIGYKTAHVILGELYDQFDGIPTDTHVKRFARRFGLTTHTDLKKISKDLESLIPKKDWKYVNNGLVLYGRYICPARPHDCTKHPLTVITKIGAGALQKPR